MGVRRDGAVRNHNAIGGWRLPVVVLGVGGLAAAGCGGSSSSTEAGHSASPSASASATGAAGEALRTAAAHTAARLKALGGKCFNLTLSETAKPATQEHHADGSVTTTQRFWDGREKATCTVTREPGHQVEAVGVTLQNGRGYSIAGVINSAGRTVRYYLNETQQAGDDQAVRYGAVPVPSAGGPSALPKLETQICGSNGKNDCWDANGFGGAEPTPAAFAADVPAHIEDVLAHAAAAQG